MALVHLANDKSFEAALEVSILDAARSAGIVLEHSCRTGRCGSCKARVIGGSTRVIGDISGLSAAESEKGYVLTCTTAALNEVYLDIEDVSILADFPSRTTPCRIDSIKRAASDVVCVTLRFPPNASPNYLPGQYVDVIGSGSIRRSYSVAGQPSKDGKIDLHIRAVEGGVMSSYWFGAAKAGDLLRMEGPKGSFFLRDVSGLELVFLATGTGIAPVKAMLEGLATRVAPGLPKSITVLWGGRTAADIYWAPDIDPSLPFDFVPVLSRADEDWSGARGYVHKQLLKRMSDFSSAVIYACGSQAMIDDASRELIAAGLPPKRFFSDAFVSSSI
ncbi:2Fe-2S iron-sulfur cluster binding domain-containing protein [Xylophilus sp. Kf1]|nr:2Fe-2S iron-sulfur cluster binding domain-containing protein [Xylophilus sp. Kf1]